MYILFGMVEFFVDPNPYRTIQHSSHFFDIEVDFNVQHCRRFNRRLKNENYLLQVLCSIRTSDSIGHRVLGPSRFTIVLADCGRK
jgi:hypothetical protein